MGFMLPPFFSAIGNFIVTHWAKIKTAAYLLTLAVGVKGFMQAKEMMGRGQDIMANKTAAGGKIPVIYGTRRVGCQVVYLDVSNNDSRDLYVVYALSVGECDEILGRTIELDGSKLTDGSRFRDGGYIGTDKISSGNGSLNTVSQNGTGIDVGAGQFGTSPTAKYRYVFNLHHGAATQLADPMLVASMPNWTSAHKLNGVAYIACHFGYDKEGMWQGVPQMTVQVRGKKVFDPRDSSQTFGTVSTYKYSDNPALCFLDLISNNDYGKGLTAAQLNMSTFTSAANVCDTEVDQPYFNGSAQPLTWSGNAGDNFITIGGTNATTTWWQNKVGELIDIYDTNGNGVIDGKEIIAINRDNFYDENEELIVYINDTLGSTYSSQTGTSLVKVKRFHCNGYLRTDKNVMENARELLANMRGIFLYINGQYELSIEDTGSSTFSINDSHIISDSGITVDYGNKDKKANKVIVEFFNANKKYELDTATVLHDANPEYYSDDGDEILEVKAEFPFITDPYIAYNMAKTILTRSRNQTTMQFVGTPEMYKLNIADIVTLTYAGLGFNGKVCRVEALELMPNGLVQVSLIEYFDVYTWEVPPQEPVEELSNLPSAYAVKAPTGLSFTDSNASSTDRPFISWNIPTDFPDAQYRINVKDSSSNQVLNKIVNVNNADLNFLPTGTNYVASITSLNTLGTESSPTTLTFTVGDAPVGVGDVQANVITANEINVTNLSAISANLGSITAGDINIGSGNFTVSTAGAMTATGATISGGITATSLNVTNATITGTLDASVITLNGEPLDDVITYTETGGIGLLTLNEGAVIDGDFVVDGNFEATGSQPDLVIGKVYNVSVINDRTISADARLVSQGGIGSFKIQSQTHNSPTLTTKLSLSYDAIGKATLTSDNTLKFYTSGSLALTLDTSQNATFTGEVTADALVLPSQTPSTTTNKLYNAGGSLYFNGSAVGGGGAGDITAVTAGTNLNGGGTSGAVTLNLDNTISITGTISSGAITSTGNIYSDGLTIGSWSPSTSTSQARIGQVSDRTGGVITNQIGGSTSAYWEIVDYAWSVVVAKCSNSGVFTAYGDFNTNTGGYKINDTTVIDNSRNLTNIGTISSGAITTSGFFNINAAHTVYAGLVSTTSTATTSYNVIRFTQGSGSGATTGLIGTAGSAVGNSAFRSGMNIGTQTSGSLNFIINDGLAARIDTSGNFQMGTTTVIDASRNLTNIGTISSGAITASGDITANSGYIKIGAASTNEGGELTLLRPTSGTTDINIDNYQNYLRVHANGGIWATIDSGGISGNSYQVGGTTVIDSSRNLSNIGTINSGAITSSGAVYATEYDLPSGGMLDWANGDARIIEGLVNNYSLSFQTWDGSNVSTALRLDGDNTATFTGAITAASTSDQILTLNQTDSSTWNYIGFQNQGTRKWYTGIDGSGQYVIGADTNNAVTFSNISGLKIGSTTFIDSSRNITSSQLYIGSWTPSNATSIGRIGKVTDRPAGSITNQLGTNSSSKWEIVDYDWTVVLASVTDAGNFTASGNVTAYSDERLKTNIQTLDSKKALQMRGVSFIKDGVEGSGVIAQEIEEIAPELVMTADDEMGTKSVAYGNLVGYLIETVKELKCEIDELKQRLDNDSSN